MSTHYRDLLVWQKAMNLAEAIYDLTISFPREEVYGLTNQMRRASVSVASNIAEGQGRLTRGEFLQFLGHARGSVFEIETQLLLATRLKFVTADQSAPLLEITGEVSRMLNGLIVSLERAA